MLKITIPSRELFDEKTNKFFTIPSHTICLEHSLVSISKWEAKYCLPFISDKPKTNEQLLYYIKCMTLTQNVDDSIYDGLSPENFKEINDYIENPMTATIFSSTKQNDGINNGNYISSELIYYWMIAFNISFECQRWHLNRLLTLIRICNIKNNSNNKMNKKDLAANTRALNAARRAKYNTKG